jgi:tRNA C32,U32 (ribose-2'-O)-methylase TrmJ
MHCIDYLVGEELSKEEILAELKDEFKERIQQYTELSAIVKDVHETIATSMRERDAQRKAKFAAPDGKS